MMVSVHLLPSVARRTVPVRSPHVQGDEGPPPVGPNIHANKRGYEEIADTFEAIVDPR